MLTVLASWTLRRALRSPFAWLTWTVSSAAIPLLELLSPLGLTTRAGRPGGWFGEILTATALAGAVFALEGLSGARGLLARHRSAACLSSGWTITASEAIFIVPSLVFGSIFLLSAALPLGQPLAAACVSVAHVAALAWLLALLPIPDGTRSIALVFVAWLLAGWISTETLPSAALAALVDVSRASRIDLAAASWGARIALLAPIIVLAGACLSIRPAPSPTP